MAEKKKEYTVDEQGRKLVRFQGDSHWQLVEEN